MDILTYSDKQIKEIVSKLLNENIEVIPIGNHELKRHLVYRVKNERGRATSKTMCRNLNGKA